MKTKLWIIIALLVAFGGYFSWLAVSDSGSGSDGGGFDGVLDREAFVSLYVDLEIAAERAGIGTPEYESRRDSVMAVYGTNFDEVTGMLSAYDAKPEKWAEVWDDILAELKKRKPDTTADTLHIN